MKRFPQSRPQPAWRSRAARAAARVAGAAWLAATSLVESGAAEPVFESEIAPLFQARCVECHRPDNRKGELDLSTAAGLSAGGESGPVVVAGEPEGSTLLSMIAHGEMPKKGGPLSPGEIDLVRRWIAGGAAFREAPAVAAKSLDQHDVLPITLLRCNTCHGPRRQEGGLDLRSPESMRRGGKSGPALVAGDPDASLMIQRIESEACPPSDQLLRAFVRRPSAAETATLRDWIAAGATEEEVLPDVATTEPDPLVSDEDRRHWAFQPPAAVPVPPAPLGEEDVVATPVDAFLLRALREQSLGFSPEADRDTLVRRAYFDLIGMPPSPEEWQRWSQSAAVDWYDQMISHLLDSPRYGERWGRYWLDLAGYADSEGGTSADPVRDTAWKYRDYVVKAFNEDKPYDRFLLEQIAGDELIDHERAPEITGEMVDHLVATGFLRMGMDQTGSRTMNFVPERLGVIQDAIHVLSTGVMGLTMECARCHTHKYDPIPQRDYYRLTAVFKGAYDEHDWLSWKDRELEVATPGQRARHAEVNPPLAAEIKRLENQRAKAVLALQHELLGRHHPALSEAEREIAIRALKKADNQRSAGESVLVEQYVAADLLPDEAQPASVLDGRRDVAALGREIAALQDQMEPPLGIRALWDRGQPSPVYLLRRGEHELPGRLVGPGVPAVLTGGSVPFLAEPPFPGGTPKTGRRLALARWLGEPDHPLTARVMVNRVWHRHFGAGLVRTMENFGNQGERPSHPELLDWLSREFVATGWSVKELHRLLMRSRAYRQSSALDEILLERDPENRLLSRMPMRRLDAEALRDSLIAVAGRLDSAMGGPPDRVTSDREGLVTVDPRPGESFRRSLYAQHRRTEMPTLLDTFDYPEMGPNCLERPVSTVSPQALMLLNNQRVRELAASFAGRVAAAAPAADPGGRVEAAYRIALSRLPTAGERAWGEESLSRMSALWRSGEAGASPPDDPEAAALLSYCHALLNSAAFLYVD